ncbi:hypothetical protein D3C74_398720 [compost metagenome]
MQLITDLNGINDIIHAGKLFCQIDRGPIHIDPVRIHNLGFHGGTRILRGYRSYHNDWQYSDHGHG